MSTQSLIASPTLNSTVPASALLAEARAYLGVPYQSQGRDRFGLDCGGFILVVGRRLGITELEILGYANSPDGVLFERVLREECTEVPKAETRPGDLLAIDYGKGVQHVAIVTRAEPLTIIHAKRPRSGQQFGRRGVIEHRLIPSLQDYICWKYTFRIPGVVCDV